MKKKFYIQPETDLMLTAPQSLICTSTTFGGETTSEGMGGEAPKRKINVMYI